jgi:putative transposase
MNKSISREQAKRFLKEFDLKDGKSIQDFLKNSFGAFLQEALENKMDNELGYSRYNYKDMHNSSLSNSKAALSVNCTDFSIEICLENDNFSCLILFMLTNIYYLRIYLVIHCL